MSVLGGLIERTDTKNINGIPGLAADSACSDICFRTTARSVKESEVLIVLTPHVIRFPSITAENLRTLAAGTDTNARVYREDESSQAPAGHERSFAAAIDVRKRPRRSPAQRAPAAQLHFDPSDVTLKPGDRTTLGLAVSNVNDLYSIPLLIHYNPAVMQVEEVRDGGFLSGGTAGDRDRAADRPAARRGGGFGHAPAEYAGGERVGHAARDRGRAVAPGKTALQDSSGERSQFAAANHPDGFRRGHDPGAVRKNEDGQDSLRGKTIRG